MTPKEFIAACNANRKRIQTLLQEIEDIKKQQKCLENKYVIEHIPKTGMQIGQKIELKDTYEFHDGKKIDVITYGFLAGGYPDTHPQGDGGIYLQFFGEKKNGEPSKRITRTEYYSVKDTE